MSQTSLDQASLNQLFFDAHTHNAWQSKVVPEALLHRLYDMLRMGPTSANCCPARIVFVTTQKAKEKLNSALAEGNRAKSMAAPVTAIIGYDLHFYEKLGKLFPNAPDARSWFDKDEQTALNTAFRNGSLQGGYFIVAARALGLDCGPMSGFDTALVDQLFFEGTSIKTNFICNIGYGDEKGVYPRNPRLDFEEVCRIV
ncbi:malonic semialdehyde reductase [Gallionella capsiferriformans]|jgi:3-hydroxypropanoate dehydrogenase|uniref:Putative NADH dehydrogenase/NAD(P)H nitroreductase Galf_2058 n=1 Tax=Gallionella capsiferriformans (strain ES-2) TaxID=395494 RepID=D9SHX4_GALCS|nr:malonic semialdehyde reductase [Gallionella capsiferriformans]ADL56064.1 nitroreductase [Gallionella capsiferriformans ES-2]